MLSPTPPPLKDSGILNASGIYQWIGWGVTLVAAFLTGKFSQKKLKKSLRYMVQSVEQVSYVKEGIGKNIKILYEGKEVQNVKLITKVLHFYV